MKRSRLVVMLLVAAALLTGCSEIPTTGPVQAGATREPNGTTIEYFPNAPAAGASRQDIVSGFLAAASAGGTFRVAKQYLSAGFASKWKPLSRVLVQGGQPTSSTSGTDEIDLTVPITARVASSGVYTPASKPEKLTFHLVQQAGQWRIDRADDGIVLLPTAFQKLYRPFAIQFFDPTWKRLVPDLRWFFVPSSRTGSAPSTRSIVDELIAGPVGAVGGGVTVNALDGAKVQSVGPSESDLTTVSLTVPESDPSPELVQRMQQQIIQSLKPLQGSLRLVLNGQVAPPVKALAGQSPLPVALVVSKGGFGQLSSTGNFTVDGTLGKRIVALHPQAVTVSARQGLAAVLTPAKQVAITSATTTAIVDTRPDLTAPTMDQGGWVYSVPTDLPNGLQAANVKGQKVPLFASVPGASITSIEVSPDGTRMLVLVSTKNSGPPEAFVAGIERDAEGTPTGLTSSSSRYPVDLGGNVGNGLAATWIDNASVAVLVASPDNTTDRVRVQQLGGTASSLADIPGAISIVGTSDLNDLRIRLATGELFVSNDQSWHQESASAPKVSVLAVQR